MRTRSLWLFAFFMFVCGSGDFLVSTHRDPPGDGSRYFSHHRGNMLAWFGLLALGEFSLQPCFGSHRESNSYCPHFRAEGRVVSFVLRYQGVMSFYFFLSWFWVHFLADGSPLGNLAEGFMAFSHVGAIWDSFTPSTMSAAVVAYLGGVIFDRTGTMTLPSSFQPSWLMGGDKHASNQRNQTSPRSLHSDAGHPVASSEELE